MADKGKNDGSSDFSEVARGLSMILQISINMIVPIGLCLFIGYELDKWLATSYLIIIFLFLGIAAGVRSVYMMVRRFYAKDLEREQKEQQYYKDMYEERAKNMNNNDTDPDESDIP
jgi:F0F1-type ATP synthase assembly protein I